MYPNPNFELKRRAREAFLRNPAVILLATLLAALPNLLMQVMASRGMAKVQAGLISDGVDITQITEIQLLDYYRLAAPDARIGLVFGVIGILCAFLTVSQWHIALKLLRGEEASARNILDRLPCFGKALLLQLLLILRLAAAMLPGFAVMTGAMLLPQGIGMTVPVLLLYLSLGLILFLSVRTAVHQALAMCALADRPELSAREALRASLRMLRYRKGLYISLMLSFIGWYLILNLVSMMLPGILGSTVSMLFSLVLSVYMTLASAAFYEAYRGADAEPVKTAESEDFTASIR